MIETTKIKGSKKGPHLLILGAIHGDEICGTYAIKKLLKDIDTGRLTLEKGIITCIPICNPKAYKNRVRYTEKNLNRVIKKHTNPVAYEEHLANILIKEIEKCEYILDLHSMHSNGKSFVFQDYNDNATIKFCKNMELEYIITGRTTIDMGNENADTIGYAHKYGKIGAVVECGQHNDEKSKEVAYETIIKTLVGLGMISGKQISTKKSISIAVKEVIMKTKKGHFSQPRNHLDQVSAGTIIATYSDEEKIVAKKDSYIVLPNETAKIGDERFYLGK